MMKFFEQTNLIGGAFVTVLTAVFGPMWFLFAGFLALNIVDWFSGWAAAKKEQKECSSTGARGILKKVMYWVVIAIAFYIAFAFVYLGKIVGVNLEFLSLLGWFVLSNYLVNEIRSIMENAIRLGVELPPILVKGLKVAQDMINQTENETLPKQK